MEVKSHFLVIPLIGYKIVITKRLYSGGLTWKQWGPMSELINPYIAGAPVTETRMFFGREDVFDWIQNSLSGRYTDHILVIHGQRRVGKTSVLKQLGNRLPKKYIPVFFDLQGRTHTSLDRFLWWLARETVRVLKQERKIEVSIPQREDFARDFEYFENVFLPGLKPHLGENNLLFTFDEFDNLEESDIKEELARPLIDYLRRMMGREEMSFIFSIGSSGRKLENMQAAYTEFFKTALYKKISFLSEDQTRGLITHTVEGVLEYDRAAIKHIYELASGHPYFTQLTCHEIFARCQRTDQRRVKDEDVNAILDDVVERGTVNLKFTWDEASDIEKWELAALAQLGKTDNRSLTDYLRKQRVRFSDSDLTSGLLHLREKDVLTPNNRFVIYLLKLWLQKNRPIEQVREELTEVNPIANRYIEIGLGFKDSGLFEKALESFQEALALAPENIQAQVNIALIYMEQKEFEQAVIEFEKTLRIDDEDVAARAGLCDAHLALGDEAQVKGRVKDAIQSYQRVLEINKEHLEARQRMAEISRQQAEKALENGKDEEALNRFAEALKYTPEDQELIKRVEQVRAAKKTKVLAELVARSEKEARARNWEKAIAILHDTYELAPEDPSILEKIETLKARKLQERLNAVLARADQAERSKRWDTAIAALNEYLDLKPKDTSIQKRLSDLVEARHTAWLEAILARSTQAVSDKRWDDAISALNEVLALEPENAEIQAKVSEIREAQRKARLEAILKKADLAAQAERWDEAIAALNDGAVSEPGNEEIQHKLAEVREARRIARQQAAIRLADTSAQAGKWDIAIQSLTEILATEPGNESIRNKLAEVQAQKRESQLKELRTRARSLAKAEKFDDALSVWQEYLALEPEDAEKAQREVETVQLTQSLANSYADAQKAYAKKNYEKTIELLKEVIDQDVNYKDAPLILAQAIEARRSAPKWWQNKVLWVVASLLVFVVIALFLYRSISIQPPTSPVVPELTATSNSPILPSEPTSTIIPTSSPTSTPAPLPYQWVRLNSGQFLQRDLINAIVIDPNDRGILYVGTENAGIYKSIDGGTSWQPTHNGLGRAAIHTLIMDPGDSKVLYAGTRLGGVYKTTDGGLTWQEMNMGIDTRGHEWVTIVVMDHQDSQHLYFTNAAGLYETTNGGESWHEIENSCPWSIFGLVVDPSDGNILYAAESGDKTRCPGGVYKSVNGGATWSITGFESQSQDIWFNVRVNGLWMNQMDGQIIYVSSGNKLWISTDSGETWMPSYTNNCSVFAFDPKDSLIAYCGSWGQILKTIDGGKQWTKLASTKTGWPSALTISPQSNSMLFLGESGLQISTTGGREWNEYVSGLGSIGYELKISPGDESTLFAQGLDIIGNSEILDHSLYQSTDYGKNWDSIGAGRSLSIDYEGKNIYILNEINNLVISKDNGISWEYNGLPLPDFTPAAIAIPPIKSNRIYALYGRTMSPYIFYSDDIGVTWQSSTGMQDVHNPRLFFDYELGQRVYAVGDVEASRSDDGGLTWQNCGAFPSSPSKVWASETDARAAVDPRRSDRLFLATRGNGILISADGCQSWQSSNNGLDSLFVNSVVIDLNNPDTLYAGTDGGVYISFDNGKIWGEINDGLLGATVVYSVVVDPDSTVYAATPYGIFKLEDK